MPIKPMPTRPTRVTKPVPAKPAAPAKPSPDLIVVNYDPPSIQIAPSHAVLGANSDIDGDIIIPMFTPEDVQSPDFQPRAKRTFERQLLELRDAMIDGACPADADVVSWLEAFLGPIEELGFDSEALEPEEIRPEEDDDRYPDMDDVGAAAFEKGFDAGVHMVLSNLSFYMKQQNHVDERLQAALMSEPQLSPPIHSSAPVTSISTARRQRLVKALTNTRIQRGRARKGNAR